MLPDEPVSNGEASGALSPLPLACSALPGCSCPADPRASPMSSVSMSEALSLAAASPGSLAPPFSWVLLSSPVGAVCTDGVPPSGCSSAAPDIDDLPPLVSTTEVSPPTNEASGVLLLFVPPLSGDTTFSVGIDCAVKPSPSADVLVALVLWLLTCSSVLLSSCCSWGATPPGGALLSLPESGVLPTGERGASPLVVLCRL